MLHPMIATASQQLAELAERLFGPEWAAPLARLTGANERTVRRIRAAASEGREYPAAAGVLAAFAEAVDGLAKALQPYRR